MDAMKSLFDLLKRLNFDCHERFYSLERRMEQLERKEALRILQREDSPK